MVHSPVVLALVVLALPLVAPYVYAPAAAAAPSSARLATHTHARMPHVECAAGRAISCRVSFSFVIIAERAT